MRCAGSALRRGVLQLIRNVAVAKRRTEIFPDADAHDLASIDDYPSDCKPPSQDLKPDRLETVAMRLRCTYACLDLRLDL